MTSSPISVSPDRAKPSRGTPPRYYVDEDWLSLHTEEVIDPGRRIVDPHHHIWDGHDTYLVPDLLKDLQCGHNIRGTVFVECSFMYRADAPAGWASLGEVEFVNGIAASFASGQYGSLRACAGIVGRVDLRLGAETHEMLESCLTRAPDRFRGVRNQLAWDASPQVNVLRRPPPPDLMRDPRFREGYALLPSLGLSFDATCYHPQLPQLIDLVDAHPDTVVIINHCGRPVMVGPYASRRDEVFSQWRTSIQALAKRPNVFIKVGGLNSRLIGQTFMDRETPPSSHELATAWRPFVDTCIDAFGSARSMFESNFPIDKCGASACVLWNAFKRLAAGYSESEKFDLFAGSAVRAYRLPMALTTST